MLNAFIRPSYFCTGKLYWIFLVILGTPIGVRQDSAECLPFISMFIADWFSEIQR
jgi:hypothetical protein